MSFRWPTSGRAVTVTALVALVASVGGAAGSILVLGDRVRTRAELVADAAAPRTVPVTATVESRVLRSEVTLRGEVVQAEQAQLRLPDNVTGVVTAVRVQGGITIEAGSAVIEVQGRPVLVLPGTFRFYRDLAVGDTGPDVEQLQGALQALGLLKGNDRGSFGSATSAALRRLYERAGYAAPNPVAARAAELWVVQQLPHPIGDVLLSVNDTISAQKNVLALSATTVRLRGAVPPFKADLAAPGTKAQVWLEENGQPVEGEVVAVSTVDDGGGDTAALRDSREATADVPVVIQLSRPGKAVTADRTYRVVINGPGKPEPVLAVPASAVSQHADGGYFVALIGPQGTVTEVDVTVGVEAQGWVEVTPAEAGRLGKGDQVVVGVRAGG